MDIRTKLVFALVAVALGSMIALGGFMYWFTHRQLKENRLEQLDGLASSLEEGMDEIASGWEDRVRLIVSRTELREILLANNLSGSPIARARVRRILADAENAEPSVESLAVYDAEGHFVGSAGWGTETDLPEQLDRLLTPEDDVVYEGVLSPEGEQFRVAYAAALTSDGTTGGALVGVLLVRLNAFPLARLARSRAGMGATGETLIAIRAENGDVHVLQQQENGPPRWERVELHGPSDPISLAMSGEEGTHSEGIVDAQGVPVWAATRYLSETGWGLVVMIEAEEARSQAEAYGKTLSDVIISLAALAIVIGTFLGLRFAKPIHELASAAERIKQGDLSVRAPVSSQDEVALLARNFNQMAEELEQQVSLLREFQNYFDLSLDMLCIAGYDGFFKRVNPAFERILGWNSDDLLSRKFIDFVHPDDMKKTEEEISRLAQGIPTISFENRYMCMDGSEKILAWTAHPEPEAGLIYAIARDVTEIRSRRKRAETEIRDLKRRLRALEASQRGEF